MKRACSVFCVLALCMTLTGCAGKAKQITDEAQAVIVNLTPAQIADAANKAGIGAAKIWVASAKPTADQRAAVAFVLNEISTATAGYKGGSFLACMPAVTAAIQKGVKDAALQSLACGLAEGALIGLDLLFQDHPDWVADGSKAASGLSAFCDGAKGALK